MAVPKPRYSWAEALSTAIALSMRAIEEVRALARQPGPPGKDGFSLDDFTVAYDGERCLTFRFDGGGQTREKTFQLPMVIDRGVWKTDAEYQAGDGVTWGGSWWIAQKATSSQPRDDVEGWRLAVKKGRDGRDGKDGQKGEPGPQGKAGRDLTQLGQDGRKW